MHNLHFGTVSILSFLQQKLTMTSWNMLFVALAIAIFSLSSEVKAQESAGIEEGELAISLAPDGSLQCIPERKFIRKAAAFNNPDETLTSSSEECCFLCFNNPRCKSWTREISTGRCALMEVIAPLIPDDNHDAGLLATVDAIAKIERPGCTINLNIYYPLGDVMEHSNAKTAYECCERCSGNVQCFSWYYNISKHECTMNRNLPKAVKALGYKAATLI